MKTLVNLESLRLIASFALAAGVAWLPPLEAWSSRWPWLVACGVLAWAASVGAQAWERRPPLAVRRVRATRNAMARRLAREQDHDEVLASSLDDAIRRLDEHILPALARVIHRNRELSVTLAAYDRGTLPAPEPAVLDRLRAVHARQQQTIGLAIQQAASADAALLAMSHARDDETELAVGTTQWVARLVGLHDALLDVLQGDEPWVPVR